MAKDPETRAHQEWLGYVQPVGLVVSIPALAAAGAHVNRNIAPLHQRFLGGLPQDGRGEPVPEIADLPSFTRDVLQWEEADLVPWCADDDAHAALEVVLPEYSERLQPTYLVPEFEPRDPEQPWMMLVKAIPSGAPLDAAVEPDGRHWQASPQAKFERMLRETQVPTGLLFNGAELRLVYAPRGESSGYMTFNVAEMATVAGRPIFAALNMLLEAPRLFSLPEKQRLPAILADSRKYQSLVSTKLAEQVLGALYELLRGFRAADAQRHGELLREVLAEDPNHVYAGLLTVLMRLVFILYAEDRGLLSSDPVFANHYSVTGLFERLRADAGRYPDTMDQRYGAWAQLLTLFRLLCDGGRHGQLSIPPRRGYLFDPNRYNFLEGRPWKTMREMAEGVQIPQVSDGVVFRALRNLLVLDGERLSYRTLDVEQIGSVYEAVMGFNLEVAEGRSIALKPAKTHGAPSTINLDALLTCKPAGRAKWLKDHAEQTLTTQAATALKDAQSIEDLLAALERKIARKVTPNVVPKGVMVLQPSDERRRSGSHYTPRSLTEPIVRKALEPVLRQLTAVSCQLSDSEATSPARSTTDNSPSTDNYSPTPDQILNLKVCDPAMGSGAFLVEACRQLGEVLVKAWRVHGGLPKLPPDEDELLYAQRMVAQRCLYGVDKNRMAVDLAKLSLWLATLAKDHPFTFLDHSLRAGDSLVGLTREQIAAFHWDPPKRRAKDDVWFGDPIAEKMRTVSEYRQRILAARDDMPYEQLRQQLDVADEALSLARFTGDLIIAAFFSASKDKQRVERLQSHARQLVKYLGPQGKMEDRKPLAAAISELHSGALPTQPFHWQIELPEVFERENGGFDCIVGNPPFLGGQFISGALSESFLSFIKESHRGTSRVTDLVAYFFRRSFDLIRLKGTFGLIATNTIAQGDTRIGGLAVIRNQGGRIYEVKRRVPWPGLAAVTVSHVHVGKGYPDPPYMLDQRRVADITSYFYDRGTDSEPATLSFNRSHSHHGSYIYGAGFTFDDGDEQANPLEEMQAVVREEPRYRERIHPYIGGEEILTSPTQAVRRYVIDLHDFNESTARRDWPKLMAIVERKVLPERLRLKDNVDGRRYKANWWRWARHSTELDREKACLSRLLVHPFTSSHLAFAFVPSTVIVGSPHNVFSLDYYGAFSVLQSRAHESWTRFFASTLEDRLRYTRSDCFETFPFPGNVESDATLERTGCEYYQFRADLLVRNDDGLTKTYNRFHDPHERSPDILKLRELHDAMDRAVLDAYGWTNIRPTCEFLLDYEEEEDDEEVVGSQLSVVSKRKKKKPWRYRWPDDVRDEVLARLLELNQKRAEEERLAGKTAAAGGKKKDAAAARKKGPAKKPDPRQQEMFDP